MNESRRNDERRWRLPFPGESNDVLGACPLHFQQDVFAVRQRRPVASKLQGGGRDQQLKPIVARLLCQPGGERGAGFVVGLLGDLGQHPTAVIVIHWPPVVGVNEAEIPEFRSLVVFGHAGRAQLEQDLRQRRVQPAGMNRRDECLQIVQEASRLRTR